MVPPTHTPDPEPAGDEVLADWLHRIRTILEVSHGGIIVGVDGAHLGAVRPLIQMLLNCRSPDEVERARVSVCFGARELLDVPYGSRVVLLDYAEDAVWLNQHRPIVQDHALVLLLWRPSDQMATLRSHAPDFLDWISHRVDVPTFPPAFAVSRTLKMMERYKWVALSGADGVVAKLGVNLQELDPGLPYDDVVAAVERGGVVVRALRDSASLWRLVIAHAQVGWQHPVVLVDPELVPPAVPLVRAEPLDWRLAAEVLELQGVHNPRVEAALLDLAPRPGEPGMRNCPDVAKPTEATAAFLRAVASSASATRLVEEGKTSSGLFIPDSAKEKPPRGKVVAVGQGKRDADGKRVALDVSKNDEILFREYAGTGIKLHGEEHIVLRPEEILAVIESDVAELARAANMLDAAVHWARRCWEAGNLHSGPMLAADLASWSNELVSAGKSTAARVRAREAVAVLRHLVDGEPQQAQHMLALARALGTLGTLDELLGEGTRAGVRYQEALSLLERPAPLGEADSEFRYALSVALDKLGSFHDSHGDRKRASDLHHRSLAIAEALVSSHPTRVDYRRRAAVMQTKIGDALLSRGNKNAARHLYEKSLLAAMEIVESEPGQAAYQRDLSIAYDRLGDFHTELDETEPALSAYRSAANVAERLTASDPGQPNHQRDLGIVYQKLAAAFAASGNAQRSQQLREQSVAIAERLANAYPERVDYLRGLATTLAWSGRLQASLGHLIQAMESLEGACGAAEAVAGRLADATSQRDLLQCYEGLVRLYGRARRWTSAVTVARAARQRATLIAEANDGRAEDQRAIAFWSRRLADFLSECGDYEQALRVSRDALAVAEQLAKSDSTRADYKVDLSAAHSMFASILRNVGDFGTAATHLRRRLEVLEGLGGNESNRSGPRKLLATSHSQLADVLVESGDNERAAGHRLQALAIWETLAAQGELNPDARADYDRLRETTNADGSTRRRTRRRRRRP